MTLTSIEEHHPPGDRVNFSDERGSGTTHGPENKMVEYAETGYDVMLVLLIIEAPDYIAYKNRRVIETVNKKADGNRGHIAVDTESPEPLCRHLRYKPAVATANIEIGP